MYNHRPKANDMIDITKVAKFIHRLQCLVSRLDDSRNLIIHRRVDQWYYMHKTEELKKLLEKFDETKTRMDMLINLIEANYKETFLCWRKDVRWLDEYLRNHECSKPIL